MPENNEYINLNLTGHGEFLVILSTLGFCLVVMCLLAIIFSLLCKKFPIIYLRNIPKYTPSNEVPFGDFSLPVLSLENLDRRRLNKHCFRILLNLLFSSNSTVYKKLGLDSLVLVSAIRLFLAICSVCMFFNVTCVIPVNIISNTTVSINITNFLNKISIDNIPNKSNLLWVHLVLLYCFTFTVYFLIFVFWKSLIYWKQRYFIDFADQNRSIIVQNIPSEINNSVEIIEHLKHYVNVSSKTAKIYVFKNCYHLIKDIKASDELLFSLSFLAKKIEKNCNTVHTNTITDMDSISSLNHECNLTDEEKAHYLSQFKTYVDTIDELENSVSSIYNVPFVLISFSDIVNAHNLSVSDVNIQINSQKCLITPEPYGIQYRNFIHSSYTRVTLKTIVWVCTIVFTLFWTIPFGLISNLASSLSNPIISSIKTNNSDLNLFLQTISKSLLPLTILMIFYLILPFIMKFLSIAEGHIAKRTIDFSIFTKFSIFHLINTYFVFLISGTLWSNIHSIITKPLSLSDRLTHGIPRQANFFTLYIIFFTNIVNPYEQLQIIPLIKYLFIRAKRSKIHLDAIFKPMQPAYPHIYSRLLYIFGIGITQSLISPFLTIIWGFYFVSAYITYTYSEIFTYKRYYSYKGVFWLCVINWITVYMIIFQLLMIGMFTLKDVNKISIAAIPLLIITLVVHMVMKNIFYSRYMNMTLETIQNIPKASTADLNKIVDYYNISKLLPSFGKISHFTLPADLPYRNKVNLDVFKHLDSDFVKTV